MRGMDQRKNERAGTKWTITKEKICPNFTWMMLNALLVKFGLEGVMGYFRPVANFNIGKKAEHEERKYFNQKVALDDTVDIRER